MADQQNSRPGSSKLDELGRSTVDSLATRLNELKESALKLTAEKNDFYEKLVKIDELCKSHPHSHPLIPKIAVITSESLKQKTKEKPVSRVKQYMVKHFGKKK